ncbi:thiamine-phosphate pyrophosphorylase [Angulomicrobium tetraedrale]|uniref:Thiamine-phosphate pyrophosphorylase n=1 Tax=Ancylobacter tetraedralis TaxID=217068 RepID=A0A839ZCB8_9HYPH|nr:thiamine phosphate synthase [Ancylobacter tetraedralis]MBB3772431.1 thiamine-phosphate pyrophosphorylase [Ancylobacter tetraedralis]
MARSAPAPIAPRLYVLVPALPVADAARMADGLRRASGEVDIAAVLLRAGADQPATALRPLVAASQDIGAACLIEADAALGATLGADGAHLDGNEALKAALPALRPDGIAGAGGLRSKHDAMTAAEAGADYVMFGEPDAQGRRPPFETTLERAEWWVQLFEPPCVAYARTLEEVVALVAIGADFIAVDADRLDDPGALALAGALAGGGAG